MSFAFDGSSTTALKKDLRGLESQDSLLRERLNSANELEVAFDDLMKHVDEYLGLPPCSSHSSDSHRSATSSSPSSTKLFPTAHGKGIASSVVQSAPPTMHPYENARRRLDSLEEGDYVTAFTDLPASSNDPSLDQQPTPPPSIAKGMYNTLFRASHSTPVKKAPSASDLLGKYVSSTPSTPASSAAPPDLFTPPSAPSSSSFLSNPRRSAASLLFSQQTRVASTSSTVSEEDSASLVVSPPQVAGEGDRSRHHHRRTSAQLAPSSQSTSIHAKGSIRHQQRPKTSPTKDDSAHERLRSLLAL